MQTEKLTISSNIDKKATEFANNQVKNDLKKDCFEYLKRHFKHHFEDGNKLNIKQVSLLMAQYFFEKSSDCNIPKN